MGMCCLCRNGDVCICRSIWSCKMSLGVCVTCSLPSTHLQDSQQGTSGASFPLLWLSAGRFLPRKGCSFQLMNPSMDQQRIVISFHPCSAHCADPHSVCAGCPSEGFCSGTTRLHFCCGCLDRAQTSGSQISPGSVKYMAKY